MSALLRPPQEFDGNLTTALCAVDVPGKGWVSGYQLSAGAAACTVAVDGAATISTTYACGCMAGNQMQGLTPPDAAKGETCDSACGQVCGDVATVAYACLCLCLPSATTCEHRGKMGVTLAC